MRKSITFCLLLLAALSAQAQYISNSYLENGGRLANLNGDCGILLLSDESDLVIEVTNATKGAKITPKGANANGRYEYEIVISKDDTPTPQMKVSRRGSVYNTTFAWTVKPDYFIAFEIGFVPQPIRADKQGKGNEVIFDATKGELEITTKLKDLTVDFPAAFGVKPVTKAKKGDNSVSITTIQFPLAPLNEAKAKADAANAAYKALNEKLISGDSQGTDEEFNRLEQLKKEADDCLKALSQLQSVNLEAPGTNRITIDLSDWTPRKKELWAIVPVVVKITEFESECDAKMAEGNRLFKLREYEAAAGAYKSALLIKGIDDNIRSTININIEQCDSCDYHQDKMFYAVTQCIELRKQGTVKQKDVAEWINTAIAHAEWLNRRNEQEFYNSRIKQFNEVLEEFPIVINFTVTRLKYNDVQGIRETDLDEVATVGGIMNNGNREIYGNTDKKGQCRVEFKYRDRPKAIRISASKKKPFEFDLDEYLKGKDWEYKELQMKVVLRKG